MKHISLLLLSALCIADPLSASTDAPPPPKPKNPCHKKITHVDIRGDLLYWVPEVSGLDTNFGRGSFTESLIDGVTTIQSKETDFDPSFHWNTGYRVAFGLQFDRNRWELGAVWTDFHSTAHSGMDHGRWKVRLHQVDVAAIYRACINRFVTLQPYLGLRGASINQKLSSQVHTEVDLFGTTALDTRTFHDRQHCFGVGPLFGLNAECNIKYGLGVYGTVAFGLLYGHYNLRFNDTEELTSPATPTEIHSHIRKHMKAFDFNVDLALGIQWRYLISNACYITMKLGLENHQYFDQGRLGRNFGNLSFSGGVYSLSLEF